MRNTICYLSILMMSLSCSQKKTDTVNVKIENNKSDTVETRKENELENNPDCVFDDNYKKLTEEWLSEVDIKTYIWDSKINKATLIYEGDTLTLYKGGCNHFVSSVEIKTDIYPNNISDSNLLTKINNIACKFKFENYCKKLMESRFKKINTGNSSYFLEFEDDDPEDNLISEGIKISEKGRRTIIEISEYYN
ncbi:hypothetical protein [Epilithonimonas lactis]|nr:hypothetical protein [Epilithonimonas lactis]SEP80714.1 hypothetical protein SAMN04488097_0709 [Epilithonimonas lactis]